jgi:hypothetical protein
VEQFFASLSKRQTMLLLTSIAFGGSDAIGSFEHLAPEEEELLKHRAQNLLQIPRDKRIPLVIQEIKRVVIMRRRQLANADPKRLAALLSKERNSLVEVVLRALPSELADACRAQLGPRAAVKLSRDVRPDVLSIVRWKLEEGLKQGAPQIGTFRFSDLLLMPQREVMSICDRMGARVLATAVAGLNDADRDALFAKLPPDQRTLAAKAADAGRARKLSEADAKTVLEIHAAVENPSGGMRSAGAQRVIRAAVAQSPEFAQRLVKRHLGGELGKVMQRWWREEKDKPVKGDGGRLDILEQIERLAQKGIIDRPLRLPPPLKSLGSPGMPVVQTAPPLTLPPARRNLSSQVLPPASASAPDLRAPRRPDVPSPGAAPRRDPIAERNARRAGVASSRPPVSSANQSRGSNDASGAVQRRILRDGKLLPREPSQTGPPSRPPRSATDRQMPKRRETAPDESPLVKGPSGRGPRGRSG